MPPTQLDDFDGFYARTYASAYRTALGIVGSRAAAEDATQEAYCSAFRHRAGFRGDGPPEAWLQRIVVNAAVDQLRRARSRPAETATEDIYARKEALLDRTPERLVLAAAIGGLPPRQRAAIVLHYFHGYSHCMVGEVLGISEGAAAMTLHRALQMLRASMDGGRQDPAANPAETRPGDST